MIAAGLGLSGDLSFATADGSSRSSNFFVPMSILTGTPTAPISAVTKSLTRLTSATNALARLTSAMTGQITIVNDIELGLEVSGGLGLGTPTDIVLATSIVPSPSRITAVV